MKITRYPEDFGNYRYSLTVEFPGQGDATDRGDMVAIMFNPATVREDSDLTDGSRTRRRLINFARDAGYRSMTEVNLFAFRAGGKEELLKAVEEQGIDPVGPENDRVISDAVQKADMVVAAWGELAGNSVFSKRAHEVSELLQGSGRPLHCLEKNRDGSPRNPARGRFTLQQWP